MLIYISNFHLFVWFLARPLFVSSLLSWHLIPGLSVGLRSSCFFLFFIIIFALINCLSWQKTRWLRNIAGDCEQFSFYFAAKRNGKCWKVSCPGERWGGGGVSFWQRVRCFAQLIMSKWVFRSHHAVAKRGLNLSAIVGKCQASATHTYYTHTHGHTCGGVCHILAHPSSDFRNFLNFRAAQIGI